MTDESTPEPVEISAEDIATMTREEHIALVVSGRIKAVPTAPAQTAGTSMDEMLAAHRGAIVSREKRLADRVADQEQERETRRLR